MKKILILVAVLAAILLVTPFFIGSKVESVIREQVEVAKQYPTYDIKISEYNKGWFSSTAKFELSVKMPMDPTAAPQDVSFEVVQDMQHGPVLWQSGGLGFGLADADINFNLPQELQSELNKVESINDDTLTITSRTAFDLSTDTRFKLNPITMNSDGAEISVKSAEGNFAYTMDGHIEGSSQWQGMTVVENNKNMEMGVMTMTIDQQLVSGTIFAPDALYVGDFEIKLDSIDVDAEQEFNLNKLSIYANSDVKDERAKIAFGMKTESVNAIGQQFDDLQYDLTLENIAMETLQELNQALIQSQGADPMVAAAQMQALLPKLMQTGPVLNNNIVVKTAQGPISTDIVLKVDQEVYDINNPMTMMIAVDAEAKGNGPEAFFAAFGMAETIEQLVQQKMLVRDESNLKFDFTFKQGQPLLNGQPMPMGAF